MAAIPRGERRGSDSWDEINENTGLPKRIVYCRLSDGKCGNLRDNIWCAAGGDRFPEHRRHGRREQAGATTLLGADIPVVEHKRGLEAMPGDGFRFFAAPVKVKGFGTFPVRAFAVCP